MRCPSCNYAELCSKAGSAPNFLIHVDTTRVLEAHRSLQSDGIFKKIRMISEPYKYRDAIQLSPSAEVEE
jgi:hypothetical protein